MHYIYSTITRQMILNIIKAHIEEEILVYNLFF